MHVAGSTLDTVAADFANNGYAVIRGFLPQAEIDQLRQRIETYVRDRLPALPESAAFYEDRNNPATLFRLDAMCRHDPSYKQLINDPRFVSLASKLLHDDVESQEVQMFGKAPRIGKETPPHQDGFYFQLVPNEALTIWLPLDRTDRGNGCIRYVVGSHKHGIRPHNRSNILGFSQGLVGFNDDDRRLEVAIEADPGDLIVHHSVTVHRADPNPSDRRRWAVGLVYYAKRAKLDKAGHEAYMKQVQEQWAAMGMKR